MKIDFTDAAKSDLKSIRDCTLSRWGGEQEEQYLVGLWDKLEEIRDNPGRWRFRRDLSAIYQRGVRYVPTKSMSFCFGSRRTVLRLREFCTVRWTLSVTFLIERRLNP